MKTLSQKGKTAALALLLLLALFQPARGEDAWKATFEETCSRTGDAMTLTVDELRALVAKCAELQKVIEVQEPSVRKVYLKRLQLCQNLYAYMLEYKKTPQAAK